MAEPAHEPLTYADLLAATPSDGPVPELVDGELRHKASPQSTHAWSQRRLGAVLDPVEGGDDAGGGWWILIEPDVVFSEHRVLRPDLAGWRRERLPVLTGEPLRLRPDWVCELLSPGHHGYDREVKRRIYGEEGVPWYWLLDPDQRYVEVFERREDRWVLAGTWAHGRHVLPPFDLAIDVERLFVRQVDEPPLSHEPPEARYG